MTYNHLKEKLMEAIQQHPDKRGEIQELLFLAVTEIESGEPSSEEYQKCWNSVQELIEE